LDTNYYIATSISVLLAFALPIGVAVCLTARKLVKLRVILAGTAVFIIFQPILRILPMNLILGTHPQLVPQAGLNLPYMLYGFILALTAGIYEEGGRYLAFRFVLKKYHSWQDGFGFGIGHGGVEALIFAGITSVTALFTNVLQPGQSPWLLSVGGIERLFAMTVQISLSLLVLYSVRTKRIRFLFLAIGLHWLVDFAAVMLMAVSGIFITETAVGLLAIAGLVWILKSRLLFVENIEAQQLYDELSKAVK
jgi:uncharacterized membrane protein YhfC